MTALRVLLPFALGFALSYAVRNVNAVIAPDLTAAMALTPSLLGLLTSAYFFTFAAFQLPLGVLLDRFGPRRVEAALLLVAAAGCFLFAAATSVTGLVIGRAMIGVGVSACLMAAFKAYVQWFPRQRLPLVNGATMAIGGFGALAATAPVEALLAHTDWRGVLNLMGGVALLSALAVFVVVPKHPDETTGAKGGLGDQIRGLLSVFRSPFFWRIMPITFTVQAAFLSIQGLWAGPWLRDIAGLDREAVAEHLLYITMAMIAGFLLIGVAAERLERIGVRTVMVAIACSAGAMSALAAIASEAPLPPAVPWCLFGFFGGAGILFYPVLSGRFPAHLTGRVITSANVLAFGGAFLAQWGIGAVINLWPVAADGGYDVLGYRTGFTIMVLGQLAALIWLMIPRRHHEARL